MLFGLSILFFIFALNKFGQPRCRETQIAAIEVEKGNKKAFKSEHVFFSVYAILSAWGEVVFIAYCIYNRIGLEASVAFGIFIIAIQVKQEILSSFFFSKEEWLERKIRILNKPHPYVFSNAIELVYLGYMIYILA